MMSSTLAMKSLGARIIVFYVGVKMEGVSVHKNLLAQHSTVFDSIFKITDYENDMVPHLQRQVHQDIKAVSEGDGIHLPGPIFTVKLLSMVVEFLYKGTLPAESSVHILCHVYAIATKFRMTHLQNAVVDTIQDLHRETDTGFTVDEIRTIYSNPSLRQSKLWDYFLMSTAGRIAWGKVKGAWAAKFQDFCKANPNVLGELLRVQLEYGKSIYRTEALHRKQPKAEPLGQCQFHTHPKKQSCEKLETARQNIKEEVYKKVKAAAKAEAKVDMKKVVGASVGKKAKKPKQGRHPIQASRLQAALKQDGH